MRVVSGYPGRRLLRRLAVWLVLLPLTASAIPPFLGDWRDEYPDSSADDAGCQLCHANPGGNTPWNAYGIELVKIYYALDKSDIREAMRIAEAFDSDGDCSSVIDEIEADAQPGWRYGNANRFYHRETVNEQLVVSVVSNMNGPAADVSSYPLELGAECGCYLVRGTGRKMFQICL